MKTLTPKEVQHHSKTKVSDQLDLCDCRFYPSPTMTFTDIKNTVYISFMSIKQLLKLLYKQNSIQAYACYSYIPSVKTHSVKTRMLTGCKTSLLVANLLRNI